jgi:hypothetical protein
MTRRDKKKNNYYECRMFSHATKTSPIHPSATVLYAFVKAQLPYYDCHLNKQLDARRATELTNANEKKPTNPMPFFRRNMMIIDVRNADE